MRTRLRPRRPAAAPPVLARRLVASSHRRPSLPLGDSLFPLQRKYLEKAGVVDALTKVLVGLYEEPERPLHAVDYVKKYIGAPAGVDADALRAENERLRDALHRMVERTDEVFGPTDDPEPNSPLAIARAALEAP